MKDTFRRRGSSRMGPEIAEAEEAIGTLQEEMKELNEDLEEKTKKVEEVKKTTSKAAKVLDQAIKEIATHVSAIVVCVERMKALIGYARACRTTRLRSWALSGRRYTGSVGSMR